MLMRRAAGMASLCPTSSIIQRCSSQDLWVPFSSWYSATCEALAALPTPGGLSQPCLLLEPARCSSLAAAWSLGCYGHADCHRGHCRGWLSSWMDPQANPPPVFGEFPTKQSPPSPIDTESATCSPRPPYCWGVSM